MILKENRLQIYIFIVCCLSYNKSCEPLIWLLFPDLFLFLLVTRLHVQSITCSSRSSSTSGSWLRPCLWSSSHPLHIYLCTPLQANQPWIIFHPIPRPLAYPTCRPKSNSLHRTPLLLIPLVCLFKGLVKKLQIIMKVNDRGGKFTCPQPLGI